MRLISYLVGGVLHIFCVCLIWRMMLEPRWKKSPFWIQAGLATLIFQVPTIIRGALSGTGRDIMGDIQLILIFGSVIVLFTNKIWTKLFVSILFYLCAVAGETIATLIIGEALVNVDPLGDSVEALILNILAVALTLGIYGTLAVFWNQFTKRRKMPKNMWLFYLFPLGQICMLDIWVDQLLVGEAPFEAQLYMVLGLLIGFLGDAILFYVMVIQGEREEVKRRLQEIETITQMERKYYQAVQDEQEELVQIRKVFEKQLAVALQINESGENEKAKEMLHQLTENIAASKKRTWCENEVVNAILIDKQRLGERNGVEFLANVTLPKEVAVNHLHLCSVFSNLLDNAIHAATEQRGKAYVDVSASVIGRYMHIKVENNSFEPKSKKKEKGHGYGLGIIKNIVAEYNGEYQAEWHDGVYMALITLELQ